MTPTTLSPKAQKGIVLSTLGSLAVVGGLLAWMYLPEGARLWTAIGLVVVGLAVEVWGVSLLMEARNEKANQPRQ